MRTIARLARLELGEHVLFEPGVWLTGAHPARIRIGTGSFLNLGVMVAAMEYGGMLSVTTELAPITQRSPIVTPLVMTTCAPHQTLSPIRVGPLVVKPCHGTGVTGSSNRCEESVT